jgi:hypothetical protein
VTSSTPTPADATTAQHEYVTSWHPSDTTKTIVALIGAVFVAVAGLAQAIESGSWTVGSIAQAAVAILLPVATYNGSYHERWFLSLKTYLNAAVVLLTALAPVLFTYWTGHGWHNLTQTQWTGFILAVLAAFGAGVIPNTKVAQIPAGWGPQDTPAAVPEV